MDAEMIPLATHAVVGDSDTVRVWMKVETGGKRYIGEGEGRDVPSAVADAQHNITALIRNR